MDKFLASGNTYYLDDESLNEDRCIHSTWQRFYKAQEADAEIARLNARIAELEDLNKKPVDILLYCPKCGFQHIDRPDENDPDWDNPPHVSHLCRNCGHVWRPSDVYTNGVESIQTKGKKDGCPNPLVSQFDKLSEYEAKIAELEDRYRLRPRSEWTEEMGEVLCYSKITSYRSKGYILDAPSHFTQFQLLPPLPEQT